MFDHVTIRVSDPQASERFYDTVLETLGFAKTHAAEWDDFSLADDYDTLYSYNAAWDPVSDTEVRRSLLSSWRCYEFETTSTQSAALWIASCEVVAQVA